MKQTLVTIAAVGLATLSCKRQSGEDGSILKFDENVAAIINFADLSAEEQVEICRRSVMMVFVGNAEEVAKDSLPNSRPPKLDEEQAELSLTDVMKDQFAELRAGLEGNNCGPWAAKQPKDKRPEVMLATIFDGPGHNDSEVVTHWYGWNEDATDFKKMRTKHWKVDKDAKLAAGDKDSKFELHLPTMLTSIAKQLFGMREGGFDQTMYFFKAHGGRLLAEKSGGEWMGPSLAHLTLPASELKTWERNAKHLFLFDPNGFEKDKPFVTSPGVYSAYWNAEGACQLLAEVGIDVAKLQQTEACHACAATLNKEKKPLGVFGGCKTLDSNSSGSSTLESNNSGSSTLESNNSGSSTLGSNSSGSSTLGSNSSGSSTLGSNSSGSSTLGSNSSGSSTLGSNSSGSSTLGSNSSGSSTLGSNSSGSSTLGSNSSGSSTLGSNSSGSSTLDSNSSGSSTLSAVGVGAGTLGGGKGFLFLARPSIADKATLTSPDGAKQLGASISYDIGTLKVEGVETLELPAGKDPEAATFIILDSCYGDAGIGSAIKGRGERARVVVVSNPSPMLADVFNYGALNLTKYIAFTQINYWYAEYAQKNELDKHPKIKRMKERLDDYLAQEGLIDMPALRAALALARREGRELTSAERQALMRPRAFRSLRVSTSAQAGSN